MIPRRIPLLWILLALAPFPRVPAGELRAGAARIDITPSSDLEASLGGYGDRKSRPATGVHDRVFAKALVFADGRQRVALVTADVLAFPAYFKRAVARALAPSGWREDEFMLLPSHSHTSIDMNAVHPRNEFAIPEIGLFQKELHKLLVDRVAQVISKAGGNLAPVAAGAGRTTLRGWNRNRRQESGVRDRELSVLRVDRVAEDRRPLAVLVHWTAHPTFMGAGDMMFSGGWPGHLQRSLEALIGGGVTVLYVNGAEGDQAPVARGPAGSNWERAQQYGLELAIEARRIWDAVEAHPGLPLSRHRETIELPPRSPHPDFTKTGGKEYGLDEDNISALLDRLLPSSSASISFRLGDFILVGIPGELAAGLGLEIKSRVRRGAGIPHVLIGGLADEWISYILAAEDYRRGGYEASVSFYGETLGRTVVDGAVRGALKLR